MSFHLPAVNLWFPFLNTLGTDASSHLCFLSRPQSLVCLIFFFLPFLKLLGLGTSASYRPDRALLLIHAPNPPARIIFIFVFIFVSVCVGTCRGHRTGVQVVVSELPDMARVLVRVSVAGINVTTESSLGEDRVLLQLEFRFHVSVRGGRS